MTRFLVLVVFLLAAVPAARSQPPQNRDGFEYHRQSYASWGLFGIHILEIDQRLFRLDLLLADGSMTRARVASMPRCSEARACFNASFFTVEDRPIGVVIADGKKIQPVRKINWGILWADYHRGLSIDGHQDFEARLERGERVRWAIQLHPVLVRDGKVPATASGWKGAKKRRTAIGWDDHGRVFVVVVPFLMSLGDLAEYGAGKLGLEQMIALDGGGSSQLVVNDPEEGTIVLGEKVPVGLGVFPIKEQPAASTSR